MNNDQQNDQPVNDRAPRAEAPNPWKWATIGLAWLIATVALVGLVVAGIDRPASNQPAASSGGGPKVASTPDRPTGDDIAACNHYAASVRSSPNEPFKDGLIGGALGAGVGAATGAIADGGKGAGKGAGIGAIVGATAGTLYGLDKANRSDERAAAAYRTCMAERGY